MIEVADLITKIIIGKEDPKNIKQKVTDFRKDFQKVHYAFEDSRAAYDYLKIRTT